MPATTVLAALLCALTLLASAPSASASNLKTRVWDFFEDCPLCTDGEPDLSAQCSSGKTAFNASDCGGRNPFYNRFRYYDPAGGRYISPDPIRLKGGTNVYAYGRNTTGWFDPFGLSDSTCPKVNVDTGTAIAFVSEGSPQRHGLKGLVAGKQMVMTQTARTEFGTIASTIAGPKERARAQEFLKRVQIVPDDPSPRAIALKETKKVGKNDKIIFGTADKHGMQTITADAKFVRGAAAQGVKFDTVVHDPVPLKGE